jgi:hypothetical protein
VEQTDGAGEAFVVERTSPFDLYLKEEYFQIQSPRKCGHIMSELHTIKALRWLQLVEHKSGVY